MENMDKKECAGGCGGCGNMGACKMHCGCECGGMQMHGWHGGGHHLLRIILKLVIIALIFSFGFSLGQMTGFIKSEYGYGEGMMKFGGSGWGMMRGYNYAPSGATSDTTPATPIPTK